jgi:hypothetical protein
LQGPSNGQDFSIGDEILLRWEPVGSLAVDEYYQMTVAYVPASDPTVTWYDETPWIKETQWALSDHDYLPGLSADGEFRWSVRVMRQTGSDPEGKPKGTPLSPMSEARTLIWRTVTGGDEGGGGQQPPPAPGPTPKPTLAPP